MSQHPTRDITPRAPGLTHQRPAASAPKKLGTAAKSPALKSTPAKPALGNKPTAVPPPSPPKPAAAGADSDWETF